MNIINTCMFDSVNSAKEVMDKQDFIWYCPGGGDIHPALYNQEITFSHVTDHNLPKDRIEFEIVQEILSRGLPLLGICRGHQMINIAAGGSLFQDLVAEAGVNYHSHAIVHVLDGPLTRFKMPEDETIAANTFHHQAVKDVAPGWTVGAKSPDGIIESIFHPELPVISVQWHPEWLEKVDGQQLDHMIAWLEETYNANKL